MAAEKPLFVNMELFSAHICLGKVHYMFYTKSLGMKRVLVSQEQQRVLQLPVGYECALCRCLHISWVLCALNDRIQLSTAFHTAFLSKHALELNLNYRERSLPLCSLSKCRLCQVFLWRLELPRLCETKEEASGSSTHRSTLSEVF